MFYQGSGCQILSFYPLVNSLERFSLHKRYFLKLHYPSVKIIYNLHKSIVIFKKILADKQLSIKKSTGETLHTPNDIYKHLLFSIISFDNKINSNNIF